MIILLVIILIVFGAGKLPEIARGMGQAIGDFRRANQGLDLDELVQGKEEDTKEKTEG